MRMIKSTRLVKPWSCTTSRAWGRRKQPAALIAGSCSSPSATSSAPSSRRSLSSASVMAARTTAPAPADADTGRRTAAGVPLRVQRPLGAAARNPAGCLGLCAAPARWPRAACRKPPRSRRRPATLLAAPASRAASAATITVRLVHGGALRLNAHAPLSANALIRSLWLWRYRITDFPGPPRINVATLLLTTHACVYTPGVGRDDQLHVCRSR